jgi:hypothetical protein
VRDKRGGFPVVKSGRVNNLYLKELFHEAHACAQKDGEHDTRVFLLPYWKGQ